MATTNEFMGGEGRSQFMNFQLSFSAAVAQLASYSFSIVNQESGTYTHHAKAALEIELTGRLDLDLSFVWDRIQDPTPADDGRVPDQDDFYFVFGLGFEL